MTRDLLVRLLDAWAATRDPVLEPAIERIGAQLAGERGAIAGSSVSLLEGAWHAVADAFDPADVSRLLAASWPHAWKAARTRALKLEKFPPDPRIAAALCAVGLRYASLGSAPLHLQLGFVIAKCASPSIASALATLRASRIAESQHYIAATNAVAGCTVTSADPKLVDEASRGSEQTPQLDALWEAHAGSPGDLAHRAVLADALLAAGDPRGELIALQLGTATPKTERRAKALIAAHGDAWTLGIPGIDRKSRVFQRGFLTAVRTSAPADALAKSAASPAWATVEKLAIATRQGDIAPLVRSLRSLRQLSAPSTTLASLAGGVFPSLETIVCVDLAHELPWTPDRRALPRLRIFAESIYGYGVPRFAERQELAARLGYTPVYLGFPAEQVGAALLAQGTRPAETRFAMAAGDGLAMGGLCVRVRDGSAEVAWCGGPHAYFERQQPEVMRGLARAGISAVSEQWFDVFAP